MAEKPTVFVVLDPTCMEQAALEWGEQVARGIDAKMHVYCCINGESVAVVPGKDAAAVERATESRVGAWLERLVAAARSEGLAVTTEVEWNPDWRKAIVAAGARQKSALVVKNLTQHSRFTRMVRETSDWTLIRECDCPVLLVKTGRPYAIKKILVAIKHSPGDDTYERANDDLLAAARNLQDRLGASLHAVTCYESGGRPDRQHFADRCGLPRDQVSAAEGISEKVISEVALAQQADLLIVARVSHPDNPSQLGNTARRVIDEIDTEVLVLPVG